MTMPGKDEGEFELILGNRQIMIVFALIVVLLGLFFALGFMVGRNMAPKPAASSAQPPEQVPITVDATKQAPASAPAPAAETTKQPEEATPAKAEAAPEETKAAAAPAKQPAVPKQLYVEQPPAGTYLQAAATQRADAETMLSYLISKTGLTGFVAPSPKSPELCRVLIGPLSGNEKIAEARAKLAELGIKNAFLVKY